MMKQRGGTIALAWLAGVLLASCAGDGCACMTTIESGFPADQRIDNAVTVRVTSSGLAAVRDNVSAVIEQLFPDGLRFDVPPDCGSDPRVCCSVPLGYCQMAFDLEPRSGDLPRLEVEAIGENKIAVTLRPRVRTTNSMPVHQTGPLGGTISCWVDMNTQWSGQSHMYIYTELELLDDSITGELGAEVTYSYVSGVSAGDVSISGGFLCGFGSESDAASRMMTSFRNQLPGAIEGFLCKKCASDSECAPFGSCGSDGTCDVNGANRCLQSLGVSGRLAGGSLLGNLVANADDKAMDLYATAGGYRSTAGDGIAVGILGGLLPATPPETHTCVPVVAPPDTAGMGPSSTLLSNTHPETGEPFGLGLAIHEGFLDQAAWAAHQAGSLCIDVGTAAVPLLNAESISLLAPSIVDLSHGEDTPLSLLVRPQTAPDISLGAGTFVDTGSGTREVDEPLIRIAMQDLEIDFYAWIDGRYVRLLTLVADADIGLNLDVDGEGNVMPVLGDLEEALSNLRVKNSTLLAESPADIADKFPAVLSIALPMLGDGLGNGLALPEMAGFSLDIDSTGFAAVDGFSRLGIFGDIVPANVVARALVVETDAALTGRFEGAITLAVSTDSAEPTEWQVSVDGGPWSPFSRSPSALVERGSMKLAGKHTVEVRARQVGVPRTLDPTPVLLEYDVPGLPGRLDFHGTAGDGGCDCAVAPTPKSAAGMLVLLVAVALSLRPTRRARAAFAGLIGLLAIVSMVACGSSKDGEDDPDDPTVVHQGPTGRWASIGSDGDRVVIAAYDQAFGDLVLGEITGPGRPRFSTIVAGAPQEPVVLDPEGYRGGVTEPGADLGAWTSTVVVSGQALIAFQDRDRNALSLARERSGGFEVHDIAVPNSETSELGLYSSMSVDPGGLPGIAMLSRTHQPGKTEEDLGLFTAQLLWAQAQTGSPSATTDWVIEVIDEVELAGDGGSVDIPAGVGAFASAAHLSDGRAVVAYSDRVAGHPMLAVREIEGWTRYVVDGSAADRGAQISLAVAADDTIYVAFQDLHAHTLHLATMLADGTVTSVELIDDGRRDDDRPHSVGGSTTVVAADGMLGVAYQDGTTSELVWATRGDGEWTRETVAGGGIGYGFYIAATPDGDRAWVSTYAYDQATWPPGHTEVFSLR